MRLFVIIYSVLRYLINCNLDGPKVIAKHTKTNDKPNKMKKSGAPAEAASHIQKMAKAKKISPIGIEINPGSMNALFTALPLQRFICYYSIVCLTLTKNLPP